jgi:hypothetical protein
MLHVPLSDPITVTMIIQFCGAIFIALVFVIFVILILSYIFSEKD